MLGLCINSISWLAFPGVGPGNLLERNLNIAAWSDLLILGEGRLFPDAAGIPTWSAGALLSLPATAVIAILGTLAGEWIQRHGEGPKRLILGLLGAGIAAILCGVAWGSVHPMIKAIWTGSFVLFASGIGLIATALFYVWIECKDRHGAIIRALEIMGRNSITAYLIHVFAVIGATLALRDGYARLAALSSPQIATFAVIGAVLAMVFTPTWWMNRRGWILRI